MRIFLLVSNVPDGSGFAVNVAGHELLQGLMEAGHQVILQVICSPLHARQLTGQEARQLAALQARDVEVLPTLFAHTAQSPDCAPRADWNPLHRVLPSIEQEYPAVAFTELLASRVDQSRADVILIHASPEGLAAAESVTSVPKVTLGGTPDHWTPEARLAHPQLFNIPTETWRQRLAWLRERWKTVRQKHAHLRMIRACAAVCIADAGAARYYAQHHPRVSYICPMWPDRFALRWQTRAEEEARTRPFRLIATTGNLVTTGTTFALAYLRDELLPQLEARLRPEEFEIHLFGPGTPQTAVASIAHHPRVRVRGFVEDLDREMLSAHAFVILNNTSTFRIGHNRLFYAWSSGICVIAHQHDAGSYPELLHDSNVLLGATPAEIAELIVQAKMDDRLRRRIGTGGREIFARRFTRHLAVPQLLTQIEAVVREAGANAGTKTVVSVTHPMAARWSGEAVRSLPDPSIGSTK